MTETKMTTLDYDFVRQQFPAFSEPSLQGWAFFQNAGGSYACRQVIDRLTTYYRQTKMQPGDDYPASRRGKAAMDESYVALASYLNVTPEEVHFGPSTSQNTYVLAQAFRPGWAEGDEIIVTNQDHEANSGAWRRLAQTGIVVKEWGVETETGRLELPALDDLLTERTRLVVMPHCSNIIGDINPMADVAQKVHAAGALLLVDGVAGAPHGFPDVTASDVDIYLFSLYKTFGPHQGLMVVRDRVMGQLSNQSHYFNDGSRRSRLIPAGPDHAQVAAAAGIAHYFDAIYEHHFAESVAPAERGRRLHTLFRTAEQARMTTLLDYLRSRPDIRLLGSDDPVRHAPTVSIISQSKSAAFLARELAEHNIMVANGDFYAVRVLNALGIPLDPGVLRISFVHYTTPAEIDQLLTALDAVL